MKLAKLIFILSSLLFFCHLSSAQFFPGNPIILPNGCARYCQPFQGCYDYCSYNYPNAYGGIFPYLPNYFLMSLRFQVLQSCQANYISCTYAYGNNFWSSGICAVQYYACLNYTFY